MKRVHSVLLAVALLLSVLFSGCANEAEINGTTQGAGQLTELSAEASGNSSEDAGNFADGNEEGNTSERDTASSKEKSDSEKSDTLKTDSTGQSFKLSDVGDYSGSPFAAVNSNNPYFTNAEITSKAYESYSSLDSLGRCGTATACLGKETMPGANEKRGSISNIKPSGWKQAKYDCVSGKYLYNRSHLIGWQLSAENDNVKNLITGTKYFNVNGMLPFENMVADYIKETNNHVMYRVTPIYKGSNLVCNGVLIEAYSVEDYGDGISFCVFCYNVQPGVDINYADGSSTLSGNVTTQTKKVTAATTKKIADTTAKKTETATTKKAVTTNSTTQNSSKCDYILNTNTKKFHRPECSSVKQMNENNKSKRNCTRDEIIAEGYTPCGRCNP
ncbi:MAG: DNA/RNA non-specific endonuclease [Acutalibacteraceae bacterium]